MYLHQLRFPKEELIKHHKKFQDAYALHQAVWKIISQDKNQKRNFLFRAEYDEFHKVKFLYVLSPKQIEAQSNLKIKISSRFQPIFEEGDALFFKLRANPIVKRDENGRKKEYGLVMDAKHQFKKNGQHYQDKYSLSELIHETGAKWLLRRGEEFHGFSINPEEVIIKNDREYTVSPLGKPVFKIRTLDFEGKLTITEPNIFKESLFSGIGSAKSFGCGLMLVRRI